MEEKFEIKEFPGYFATKSGKIYSTKKCGLNIMSGKEDKNGYIEITFIKNRKKIYRRAHRIIARMFVDGETVEKNIVNHIDKNVKNNSYNNLEWVTNRDNINHGNLTIDRTSKLTGVYLCKRNSKWASGINICGKKFWVGYFETEQKAASTYNFVLEKIGKSEQYIANCEAKCYNDSIIPRLNKVMKENGL